MSWHSWHFAAADVARSLMEGRCGKAGCSSEGRRSKGMLRHVSQMDIVGQDVGMYEMEVDTQEGNNERSRRASQ